MKLLCIGDIAISDHHLNYHIWSNPACFSPDHDNKILFNWEIPMGENLNQNPRECGGVRLLSSPNSVQVINRWAPGFVALATNHMLDGGEEGLGHTITLLEKHGFSTIGAGLTQEDIQKPLIWETEEGSLAIINWVFPETHPDSNQIPGPNYWPGKEIAADMINSIHCIVDWILVFAHWSDELFPYPRPEDRFIAKELAEIGVDFLICHHPHVVRGYERIINCEVFYSLGNFFFSDFFNEKGRCLVRNAPKNNQSIGLHITFSRDKQPIIDVLSFIQKDNKTYLDKKKIANKSMLKSSVPLRKYKNDDYCKWYLKRRKIFNSFEYRWHFVIRRDGIINTISRILSEFFR